MLKELIKELRHVDYPEFRNRVMDRCAWSINQYNDRYNGRTKLTASEREVITNILEDMLT